MLTGPLMPLPAPFPRTPGAETRATVPMTFLPLERLIPATAMNAVPRVEVAIRFPEGVVGTCPVCGCSTTGVASVGVPLMAASATAPFWGPLDVVLEGGRPISYRLEPCGCCMKVR